jgi:hypothetical protein
MQGASSGYPTYGVGMAGWHLRPDTLLSDGESVTIDDLSASIRDSDRARAIHREAARQHDDQPGHS